MLLAHELQPRAASSSPGAPLIGDRREDVRAALANGLTPIGITWGYGDHAELASRGAKTILDSPAAVLRTDVRGSRRRPPTSARPRDDAS